MVLVLNSVFTKLQISIDLSYLFAVQYRSEPRNFPSKIIPLNDASQF